MSASEQASEPSSSSSLPPLPPPLPPPPRPPVAAEGRGAQAAPADAVWARIREAPRCNGPAATGLLICVRLAYAPPPARPALASSACTFLAATFLSLTLQLPGWPRRDAGLQGAWGRGGEGREATRPGGRREGEGMHSSLPALHPELSLLSARPFGDFEFRDEKDGKRKVCALLDLLPSSRETARLSRGKGGECCPGKKSQQTARAQKLPHAAPRALAVPGGGEVCKKPWECVRGVSGAAAPTEPSAGSLAFDDLTRDLAGLGEQSKGGSPIRERRDTSSLMAHEETPA